MRSRRSHSQDPYRLAEELNDLGDHERALPFAERAVADDPRAWRNWCSLARTLNGLFRYGEGLRAAERALALEPEAEWAHRMRAYALKALGRRSEALEAGRESVSIRPDLAVAWREFAVTAESLGYESEARSAAERAVSLDPNHASHWVTLSFVCLGLDWDAAHKAAERALQLEPENTAALNNLGWVHLSRGRPHEARELFDRAIRIAPGHTKFLYNRAIATGMLEGREVGAAEFRRTQDLHLARAERRVADRPENASAHASQAQTLLQIGADPSVVLEKARRAPSLDPHVGWGTLMEAAGAAGRWQLARYAARRAIDVDPSTPSRWNNAAEVAIHFGRPDEARLWANRVVTEAPDSRAFPEAKSLLCFIDSEFESALAIIREALDRSPLNCCRQIAAAACYIELGDGQSAQEALERAELIRPTCGCFRRKRVQRLLAGN